MHMCIVGPCSGWERFIGDMEPVLLIQSSTLEGKSIESATLYIPAQRVGV